MTNENISLNLELTEGDARYLSYADDLLSLRDIQNRLKDKALLSFGESVLSVLYDTP